MKQMIFSSVSVMVLLALPASGSMVRGTISDSATGAPISTIKVLLAQSRGEWPDSVLDSSMTGTTGSYAFSGLSKGDFRIYTFANGYYFQSTSLSFVSIDDTITKNIKLKSIPTMVSGAPNIGGLYGITIRAVHSRLYVSGIKAGAVVCLYNLNGRRLFRTAMPAGASEVMIPERIAAAGCYQVSIRANGCLIRGMKISRGRFLW
jgi:hypothetical protein